MTNANHTVDTSRPKSGQQLIKERVNALIQNKKSDPWNHYKRRIKQRTKNILRGQNYTCNQCLALEIQNRTIWTNKKVNLSHMKDANNMITDEAGNKCGETGDTGHQFVECERKKYGHAFNQSTKTAAHLETIQK